MGTLTIVHSDIDTAICKLKQLASIEVKIAAITILGHADTTEYEIKLRNLALQYAQELVNIGVVLSKDILDEMLPVTINPQTGFADSKRPTNTATT